MTSPPQSIVKDALISTSGYYIVLPQAAFIVVNALGVALILSGPTLGITNIYLSVPTLLLLGGSACILNNNYLRNQFFSGDSTKIRKFGNILVAIGSILWLGFLSCNILGITGHLSGYTLGWIHLGLPVGAAGLGSLTVYSTYFSNIAR